MYKAVMRDGLGWMKDAKLVTGSIQKVVEFMEYYGAVVAPDELKKLDKNVQMVVSTTGGLKLSVKVI